MSNIYKDTSYPKNKDPHMEAYLDKIRAENKAKLETCWYCDEKSEYFDCIEYRIISVCKKHFNFNTSS